MRGILSWIPAQFHIRLLGEDHKDRIAVFDAIQSTEPGHGAACWLDGELVPGLYFSVGASQVLPFKVVGSRYDASAGLPGIFESWLFPGGLNSCVKERPFVVFSKE